MEDQINFKASEKQKKKAFLLAPKKPKGNGIGPA